MRSFQDVGRIYNFCGGKVVEISIGAGAERGGTRRGGAPWAGAPWAGFPWGQGSLGAGFPGAVGDQTAVKGHHPQMPTVLLSLLIY